jgi:hypothetical protein
LLVIGYWLLVIGCGLWVVGGGWWQVKAHVFDVARFVETHLALGKSLDLVS